MAECEVNYSCACDKPMPLIYLFFCRHCVKLRCPKCVSHEVDSYYCPHCLENMPSAEAKAMKNRCPNCLECPNCSNDIGVRSAQVPTMKREGGKLKGFPTFKKVYYMQCTFCFWTTRDIKMQDKATSNGPWIEPPEEDKWMGNIINFYRHLMQREKLEMEKRTRQRRGSFLGSLGISDKLLPFAKIRSAFSMNLSGSGQFDENLLKSFQPQEASEETEPADEMFYTSPGEVYHYASIGSRIRQPGNEAEHAVHLKPQHKHLMVKRSQRCRECEHNLSKPEFNPSSIKFKIQLIALHFVPRFRIAKKSNLVYNEFNKVMFSLTNPTESDLPIEFIPLTEKDKWYSKMTAEIKLPPTDLILAARDDTAQYDENVTSTFTDDPEVVTERRMNKLTFVIHVKPMNKTGEVKIGFYIKYKYKSIAPTLRPDEQKEPKDVDVMPCILVSMGNVGE